MTFGKNPPRLVSWTGCSSLTRLESVTVQPIAGADAIDTDPPDSVTVTVWVTPRTPVVSDPLASASTTRTSASVKTLNPNANVVVTPLPANGPAFRLVLVIVMPGSLKSTAGHTCTDQWPWNPNTGAVTVS